MWFQTALPSTLFLRSGNMRLDVSVSTVVR